VHVTVAPDKESLQITGQRTVKPTQ